MKWFPTSPLSCKSHQFLCDVYNKADTCTIRINLYDISPSSYSSPLVSRKRRTNSHKTMWQVYWILCKVQTWQLNASRIFVWLGEKVKRIKIEFTIYVWGVALLNHISYEDAHSSPRCNLFLFATLVWKLW